MAYDSFLNVSKPEVALDLSGILTDRVINILLYIQYTEFTDANIKAWKGKMNRETTTALMSDE